MANVIEEKGEAGLKPDHYRNLCTHCGVNPRAAENSTNHWCKECNAEQKAAYRVGQIARAECQGFVAGANASRAALAVYFAQWPFAQFSGAQVAAMIQTVPPPRPTG